jgi:hypothetical protein
MLILQIKPVVMFPAAVDCQNSSNWGILGIGEAQL